MNKKENVGFQKTHQAIKDCLLEMLQTKPLRDITIQALCMTVKINRSTFYAHFEDIYDVLSQISRDLDQQLLEAYARAEFSSAFQSEEYILVLLEHLKRNRRFYCVLLGDPENPIVRKYMEQLLQLSKETPVYPPHMPPRVIEYYFEFMRAGFLSVVKHWLDERCPETPGEMAEILANLRPAYQDEVLASLVGAET
ncbi:MAG: TetR/AcrR family transcriptional regulator [Eubacteriales bacterium]|nr:TetR/AcrR family transcriptional regulator [Eubacteriales bacterium]